MSIWEVSLRTLLCLDLLKFPSNNYTNQYLFFFYLSALVFEIQAKLRNKNIYSGQNRNFI